MLSQTIQRYGSLIIFKNSQAENKNKMNLTNQIGGRDFKFTLKNYLISNHMRNI